MRQLKQLAACLTLVTVGLAAAPAYADAIITNGSGLYLGVNDEGHLNTTDGNVAINSGATGLSWTWADGGIRDATSPGCYCEGYGFGADNGVVHSGYANAASGINNIVADGPVSATASTASTSAHLGSLAGLVITHAYAPSVSPNAYEVTVTITNNTGGTVNDVRYMRAMDWDIPMTEFNEFVTLFGWPATNLIATSNDGFDEGNPFGGAPADIAGCGLNVNFTACGASDHGAAFIFGFGSLDDGESLTFRIFYGAGDNEREAFAALAAVGAEVGSLGYSNDNGAPNRGSPVYFFGFAGVGGTPIPEPSGIALLGLGMLGFVAARRRNK